MKHPIRQTSYGVEVRCPYGYEGREECDGIPHIMSTVTGRIEPSTSGAGLWIEYRCEWGHHWEIQFIDHSGGTWVDWRQLPDLPEEKEEG